MALIDITEPVVTDVTGQAIVNAIQNISKPSASEIPQTAISGEDNVDDALAYLKNEVETVADDVVKSVNGKTPDETGAVSVDQVKFAEQIVADDAQQSSGTYIIRTTGGDASLSDGDAQLVSIFGRRTHVGYQPEVLTLTVNAAERTPYTGLSAEIDNETFIAYVKSEAGTYTVSYTDEWSTDPELYGLTITGDPENGDYISISYDGENDPVVTVYAPRNPVAITATIDRDTFVSYVAASSTITLTYSSGWSESPALYGVTVTGTPIDNDEIEIGYVKEDRGVITQSNPTSFKSTGWNLYNNTLGYARVIKYSDIHGFMIGGTYSAVKFSTTLDGEKTTITPADGHFNITEDGYVWVTGGNSTNTFILMEWSDWTNGYEGSFKTYSESTVNLASVMTNFPYGLMQVGAVYDEINLNMGIAYSRVERRTYSASNLAYAKASGRTYECDRSYIYIAKETVDTYSVSVDGAHTACDHGMEIIEGTTIPVFVQTLYGQNLVDKLRTDVLTKSTDLVNNLTTNDSTKALSAAQGYALNSNIGTLSNQVAQIVAANAGSHNSIYRGKYLGSAVTSAQWTAIKNGVFDDLFIGDYWTINSVNWRIAAFDYWVNVNSLSTHHVVIVPDSNLASSPMNSTNTTAGAYYNSDFRTGNNDNTGRSTAIEAVNNAFGSGHILTYKDYLHSAVTDGHPSGQEWADCTVELMNEEMVYGARIFSPSANGTAVYSNYTTSKSQLPLFQHEHSRISNRANWWLRSVVSGSYVARVDYLGYATSDFASISFGVRPAFGIFQS